MTPPTKWPAGRLAEKIALARNGDPVTGRELLGMAALQLQQFDELEPDLRRYLEQLLLDLSRCASTDAARVAHISEQKQSNRPKNERRIRLMLDAWNMARTLPTIDPGDEGHIRKLARKVSSIKFEDERYAQCVDLLDELREAERYGSRPSTSDDTYELAALIFNHLFVKALGEAMATGNAIKAALNRAKDKNRDRPDGLAP